MVEVARRANQHPPDQGLTLNAWDCVERFYWRLGTQFQTMLNYFIDTSEDRVVDPFLELWRIQYSHSVIGANLWQPGAQRGWMQNMTDNAAQRAMYMNQVVVNVLLRYAELLRAIQSVPSGIATQGHRPR